MTTITETDTRREELEERLRTLLTELGVDP